MDYLTDVWLSDFDLHNTCHQAQQKMNLMVVISGM